jgi:hypothetical protein
VTITKCERCSGEVKADAAYCPRCGGRIRRPASATPIKATHGKRAVLFIGLGIAALVLFDIIVPRRDGGFRGGGGYRGNPNLDQRGEHILNVVELSQIEHEGTITYDDDHSRVSVKVHNGTQWRLTRMTIEIHVRGADDHTLYRQMYEMTPDLSGVAPLSAGGFDTSLSFGFKQGQKWNYKLVGGVGVAGQR